MSLALTARPGRERSPIGRRERRRLAAADRHAAHLAELHHIRGLLAEARGIVEAGWTQHSWFVVGDGGARRAVDARNLQLLAGHPVAAACLVGAIVEAGGGVAQVRSQPVQRALDLTWHTRFGVPGSAVHWCPPPHVRAAHVRDLTSWNDHPRRRVGDVTALLDAAERAATAEIDHARTLSPLS
jgi:hypothetical protein